MKIFEIGTGYTPIPAQVAAATESVVEELTKAFIEMKQPVEIIDIWSNQRADTELPITQVYVPSVFTKSDISLGLVHKLKRVVYSVFLAFKLKKILKLLNEKAVFHFHNQYNLFFFLKLVPQSLRKKAVIAYTNHNGLWSLNWDDVKDTLHKRYFQEIIAMENADLVFVLNKNTKENIVNRLGVEPRKVIEIYNGVNTDIYRMLMETEIEIIKSKHNLSSKKVILQVGSVYENKGQVRCVEMLAPLLKKHDNLVYAFAGGIVSQEYFEKIKITAHSCGVSDKVVYLGAFAPGEEMNEIYNMGDATVFASEYEGFPLVCAESISCGVPVILCSDLSINLGTGCVIANTETIETDINDAIFSDFEEYKKLSFASRKNAENNYSWKKIAHNYLTAFEQL